MENLENDVTELMEKSVQNLKSQFSKVRSGRGFTILP